MKKQLFYLLVSVIVGIILSIMANSVNYFEKNAPNHYNQESYTIFETYNYPIRPGSDEWNNMSTNSEIIAACAIPEDTLHEMSTDALLVTILDYPLITDMGMYSSFQLGYEAMKKYFPALEEFEKRSDARKIIVQELGKSNYSDDTDGESIYRAKVLEVLLQNAE